MAEENVIPLPVRFNAFKHHRNFILGILESGSAEVIMDLLDPVCNNYIDIYTGQMSLGDLAESIVKILQSRQVFHLDDFNRWVDSKNGYRQISIEDGSEWIVRKSIEAKRYIHLHPAREGMYAVRYKGSTLKTAYLLKIRSSGSGEIPTLEMVNRVRIQIGLSPVKKLERSKGILNCYEKFFSPQRIASSGIY